MMDKTWTLEAWFPIYALHNPIPMFIFAAGYFYNETCSALARLANAKKNTKKTLNRTSRFFNRHF